MKTLRTSFIAIVAVFTMWGCTSLYDHFTFTETLKAKTEALNLIEKSDTQFNDWKQQVADLQNHMETMEQYERSKAKNEITFKMWELIASDKHLMGSYLKLWEEKGSLNTEFKKQAKPQIEKAFDLMIHYEEQKDKKSENALNDFIKQFLN